MLLRKQQVLCYTNQWHDTVTQPARQSCLGSRGAGEGAHDQFSAPSQVVQGKGHEFKVQSSTGFSHKHSTGKKAGEGKTKKAARHSRGQPPSSSGAKSTLSPLSLGHSASPFLVTELLHQRRQGKVKGTKTFFLIVKLRGQHCGTVD